MTHMTTWVYIHIMWYGDFPPMWSMWDHLSVEVSDFWRLSVEGSLACSSCLFISGLQRTTRFLSSASRLKLALKIIVYHSTPPKGLSAFFLWGDKSEHLGMVQNWSSYEPRPRLLFWVSWTLKLCIRQRHSSWLRVQTIGPHTCSHLILNNLNINVRHIEIVLYINPSINPTFVWVQQILIPMAQGAPWPHGTRPRTMEVPKAVHRLGWSWGSSWRHPKKTWRLGSMDQLEIGFPHFDGHFFGA